MLVGTKFVVEVKIAFFQNFFWFLVLKAKKRFEPGTGAASGKG
jgi:hypothetical protein